MTIVNEKAPGIPPRKGAMTLRVLAALLSYPDANLRSHLGEMSS